MTQISPLYAIALRWMKENGDLFSRDTLRIYDSFFLTHIIPVFGDQLQVKEEDIRSFMDRKKAKGLADTTVYKMQRLLYRVLEYGAATGECCAPQWDLGLGAPESGKKATILSVEEQNRLERYLVNNPGPKHLCMFLMLTTGIGAGEVQELKWEDVSLKNGRIRVMTERGIVSKRKPLYRLVTIGERQKIYLKKMESSPDVYLWTGKTRQLAASGMRTRLVRVIDEMMLPWIRVSDLRRCYAVRCLENGMTYRDLARNLGLKDVRDVRDYYAELLPPEIRDAREKEYQESFNPRKQPEHINHPGPDSYPEAVEIRKKIEAKKAELQYVLDNIEFDLDIVNTLRNSDGVQGKAREGLYQFVEKVLGPNDKDGQYLVEYMRYNMRVATMPLRVNNVATVQAIRRRVSHGFEKLCKRLDEINAVEGLETLPLLRNLCDRIQEIAPPAPIRTGRKGKPSLEKDVKNALDALERERQRVRELEARLKEALSRQPAEAVGLEGGLEGGRGGAAGGD
ncbi:MAG: site-specific integrase [Bacteroidales bacterium]|nr:site-specific integrase [Bacteroidales bacterium]